MTKKRIVTVPWPVLCESCGQALARKISERPDLDVVTTWCPHTGSFAMAYAGEIDGRRGVIRWDTTGPIEREEAERMIAGLGAVAESSENLEPAQLH